MSAIQSAPDRVEFPSYAQNFALMHEAMRRDAQRLVDAADTAVDVSTLARWFHRFEAVIEHHHRCEDEIVWPGLLRIVDHKDCGDEGAAFRAAHRGLLDDHEQLDGAMGSVRDSLHRSSNAVDRCGAARRFQLTLEQHLSSEEAALFPLLRQHVTEEEFLHLEHAVVSATPLRAMTFTVPWVLDDAPADLAADIVSELPLPIRIAHRSILQPRYRRLVHAATGQLPSSDH